MANPQKDAVYYKQLMDFCAVHAKKAGSILLKHFDNISFEKEKNAKDPVTNVDLEAQQYYLAQIKKEFPQDGFLGEESGSLNDTISGCEYTWIVDPVDGTINYSAGIPLYCSSIGVARSVKGGKAESVAGAVYDPVLKELFCAFKGGGAWLNGKPIKVTNRPLEKSVVAISLSSHPEKLERELDAIRKLNPSVRRFRALGSIAHEVCHIAAGRLAASIHTTTTAWDGAAANLIAQEAGGIVTDLSGKPWDIDIKDLLVSNDHKTHQLLLKALNGK